MKAIALFGTAALAASALAGTALSSGTEAHPLAGTQWALTTLGGTAAPEGVDATLNFGTENDIGGNGGCNTYGGSVSFEDNAIDVTQVFSTMMACPEPAMGQERALFDALETAAMFTLEAETLTLTDADGAALAQFVSASD